VIIPPALLPRFSWENLKINDDLGRVEGVISASAVRAHAFAIGDNPNRYLRSADGSPFVPPSLLVNDLLKMVLLGYDGSNGAYGGLHTKAVIDYVAPLAVGERVTVTGTHVAKYARKGRRYRTLLSQAVREDGLVIARLLATETVLYDVTDRPDEGEIPKHWAASLPHVDGSIPEGALRAAPGVAIAKGMVLGPISRDVSIEQSVVFSGYPFSWAQERPVAVRQSLHTNPDIAKKAGYRAPVAQGLLCAAHHTSLLLDHFGSRVTQGAQIALSFVSPVLVGKTLRSHALVDDEVNAGGTRFTALKLATKNADGQLIAAGHARVPL
jgi:acyl dehydratase